MPCRSRTLSALLALLACHCASAGQSTDGGPPPTDAGVTAPLDPVASQVSASPATGVFADGVTASTITITLVDTTGAPMSGVPVSLSATGADNTIVQPEPTDRTGTTTGTIASTAAETKTVTASIGSVELSQQPAVQFVAGPATQLAFVVQPSSAVSSEAIAPAVIVAVEDAQGRRITSGSVDVTIKLAQHVAGGTLSGTVFVPTSDGAATFSDLKLDKAGTYTLSATSTGLTAATSGPLQITPGPLSQLAFAQEPTTAASQVPFSPSVVVELLDAAGNRTDDSTTVVSIGLASGTTGARLAGALSVTAAAGEATFMDLSVNLVGTYTLTASTGELAVTSTPFAITPGTPELLSFTSGPSGTKAGTALAPVQVTLTDAAGNTVDDSVTLVTVALGLGAGTTVLAGTTTELASHGVATFSNLSLTLVGTYSLTATALQYTTARSGHFAIVPANPAALQFTVQPGNVTAGTPLSPAVQVTLEDAWGNTIPDSSTIVTLALGTNLGGGTVAGTKTATALAGVATFPDLSLTKAGTGYTFVASATGYPNATSSAFNVGASLPSALVFTTQPLGATAGIPITPSVQVTLEDQYGNTISDSETMVNISLGATSGGALSGTPTATSSAGVATFPDLVLTVAGNYTLQATAPGYAMAASQPFTVSPGLSTAVLTFLTQPTATIAGALLSPALQVGLQDTYGNTIDDSTTTVTLTLGANPAGGSLAGTVSEVASHGIATFPGVSITRASAGYTLTASAAGYLGATSTTFAIVPAPASVLLFTAMPSTTIAGDIMSPAVQLKLEDFYGNTIPDSTTPVTLALSGNPGGATLSGTLTRQPVNGVVSFPDLSMTLAGTYGLIATAPGYADGTSGQFEIKAATPAALFFNVEPSETTAGKPISPAVQVTLEDRFGNTCVDSTETVTLALGANPGTGTLTGTLQHTAAMGVATFGDLSLTAAGTGYALVASAAGCSSQLSSSFVISASGPAALIFSAQPGSEVAGVTIAPAVQVTLKDQFGNTIPDSTTSVTIALDANPGGGTLSGTLTQTASSGIATFPDLGLTAAALGYTLQATAPAYGSVISDPFNIAPGPFGPVFTQQPASVAPGMTLPEVQVTVEDAYGNLDGTAGPVTLQLQTASGTATLGGTTIVPPVSGVASFTNLSINTRGIADTLSASVAGLTPTATSNAFNVATPGWYSISGTPAGNVTALSVAPWSSSDLFLGTTDGLYESTNEGVSWQAVTTPGGMVLPGTLNTCGTTASTGTAYAVLSNSGQTAATLYSTTNGGTTWTAVFDAGSPDSGSPDAGSSDAGDAGAEDAGAVDAGPSALSPAELSEIDTLVADPASSCQVVYAGLNVNGVGVLQSIDSGNTWTPLTAAQGGGTVTTPVSSLVLNPLDTSNVYQAGPSGGYMYPAGGGGWEPLASLPILPTWNSLAWDPENTSVLFVGTATGGFYSVTDGSTWVTPAVLSGDVLSIVVGATGVSGEVYALESSGLYSSTSGTSFTLLSPAASGAVATDTTGQVLLFGTSNPGLELSTNAGTTLTAVPWGIGGSVVTSLALAASSPGTYLVGTGNSFAAAYLSTNAGTSWSEAYADASGTSITAVGIDPHSSTTLYVADTMLYKQTAGGAWQNISPTTAEQNASVILFTSSSGLRIGTSTGSFAASDDGGATWRTSTVGFSGNPINGMSMDVTTSTTLYAATTLGLYVSLDDGNTWASTALTVNVTGLVQDPGTPLDFYAATTAGLYASTDGAQTWTALTATPTTAVALAPGTPPTLFAATTAGVSSSTTGGQSWTSADDNFPSGGTITSLQLYPGVSTTLFAATSYGLWENDASGQ